MTPETLISSISEASIWQFIRTRNRAMVEHNELLYLPITEGTKFSQLTKLGEVTFADTDRLLLFSCRYSGELSSRSARKMQFEVAKAALKDDFKDGAVFVFFDAKGYFRFSFIRRNYGEKEQKYSPWKRYTYFVEPNPEKNRTFKERVGSCAFDSLDAIQAAFSVEPLSIAFFDDYKKQYEKFCAYMQSDSQMQQSFRHLLTDGTNKAVRDYVKKMLGRIVFLQFLQKKGWLGVPKDATEWKNGDRNFLENLFINSSNAQQADFLDSVLEPMFFNSLNCARANDLHDTQTALGVVKIPYLNGGLFEEDELDKPASKFPSHYFRELFAFFNQYNFTIDENDPNDAEVGVDPEMLGHIFENLLEDNKDKGAFYTPKEIVHYMCQESLTEYLCTALTIEEESDKQSVRELLKMHDVPAELQLRTAEIDAAIDAVKICDPAIGSGAFPMGLLQQIFAIKQTFWYDAHRDLDAFPASEVKQNIIQNSIYGVDIEKGAVDIARLRFWLSLVVDEKTPKPLPNLDYKIMQGNSLIESFEGHDLSMIVKQPKSKSNNYLSKSTTHSQLTMGFEADETAANLNILLKEYFKTNNTDEKHLKKEQIEEQVREHIKNCAGHTPEIIAKVDAIDFDNKPFFLWHLYFADVFENGGFDIVIGNPPYIEAKKLKSISLQLKKKFKTYTGTADLSIYFIEQGLYLNKKNGYLTFITTNKFFNTGYGKPVRSIILENKIQQIINFEQVEVFEGILVSSVILGVTKIRTIEKAKFKYNKFYKLKAKEFKIQFAEKIEDTNFYNQTDLGDREWSFADATHLSIKEKIEAEGRILTPENDKVYIYRGITTGYNPAFIITDIQKDELIQKDVNNKSIIKNLLQGRNIRKWVYNESIENLIFTKQGVDISKYPSIESHLNNFFTNLNPREELEQKDEGKTVSGRKPGTYKWYEIQDNTAYYKEFEKQEKIIWGLTADKWAFAYDDEQHYLPSNGYLLTSDIISIKYILGLLNSNIMKYYFGFVGVMTAGGAYTLKHSTIQKLPLKIAKSTASIQVLVDKIITSKKENPQLAITTFERQIDELVFKLYDLTYEEVKVVCPDFWLSEVEYNAIEL